jgi:Flp pilus assembly protein TadD
MLLLSKFCGSALVLLALVLAGCQSGGVSDDISSFGDSAKSVEDLSDVSYYPTDELITKGKAQFKEGNYGKSYAIFKRAVDVYPKDPQAWLGYAASADHIGRFDNADIGYGKLARMIPNRIEYLNNRGYSYMLRGDLKNARTFFLRAYEIDPSNETTANNIELLRNSASFVKRGKDNPA